MFNRIIQLFIKIMQYLHYWVITLVSKPQLYFTNNLVWKQIVIYVITQYWATTLETLMFMYRMCHPVPLFSACLFFKLAKLDVLKEIQIKVSCIWRDASLFLILQKLKTQSCLFFCLCISNFQRTAELLLVLCLFVYKGIFQNTKKNHHKI